MNNSSMVKRAFGATGVNVTAVGLGGEGILRTFGEEQRAVAVIGEAVDAGITYFDCARAYAGSESYYGRFWSQHRQVRSQIFQAGKSANRTKKGALTDLDLTLRTMAIDHLDLWQIHDVRTAEDLRVIAGPGGALEAFLEAKAQGKTRFVGVTGHHDPAVLTAAVRDWPVDAVMMPVNPVEAAMGGFLDSALPQAQEKGIAVIGMKVLGAGHYLAPEAGISAEILIHFALSQPITVAIVGCSTPQHVRTLSQVGHDASPLPADEIAAIIDLYRPHSRRLAFYRGNLR